MYDDRVVDLIEAVVIQASDDLVKAIQDNDLPTIKELINWFRYDDLFLPFYNIDREKLLESVIRKGIPTHRDWGYYLCSF